MPRIIFISPHFKSGSASSKHLSYLVRYIATREGVSPLPAAERKLQVTAKQTLLIAQLLRDFPMAKNQFEYEDYLSAPTRENADDFIRTALEQNLNQLSKRHNSVDYIGRRPGVAILETNGLFDGTGRNLVVSQVQKEIAEHPGVVWTPVISLQREDAHAMGLESPESWRAMLSSCAADLAKGYKINPEHLKWYAAFHDNSHHPHVHMILYSTDPTEGFLTKQGITEIKSVLAQRIFPEQLQELYAADTKQRDALKAEARTRYLELIEQRPRSAYNAKPVKANLSTELMEIGRRLSGPREMVKLLKLYANYGEKKILAALSQQSGQEISIQQIEAQLLVLESPLSLQTDLDIKVERHRLNKYDDLLKRRVAM